MRTTQIVIILCTACILIAITPLAFALNITVDYNDGVGEGFKDSVVGAQRRAAFEHAVSIWAGHLDGTIPLIIRAEFNNLAAGVLGETPLPPLGSGFSSFPEPGYIFVAALASQLEDNDIFGHPFDDFHMEVRFNTDFEAVPSGSGKWYYGTDGLVPSGDSDFVSVALHEIGHSLGMIHSLDALTGNFSSGNPFYMIFFVVRRGSTNLFFKDMTDAQRLAAITSGEVYFAGPNIIAANIPNPSFIPDPSNPPVNASGEAKLYAPSPLDANSFVDHWDPWHFPAGRPLLMQPAVSSPTLNIGYTKELLKDLGWTFQEPTPEIQVNPTSLTFNIININAGSSSAMTVTITNSGSVGLEIIGIALEDAFPTPDADQFQITSDTTPGTLAPSQTRDVTVVFDPDSNGFKFAYLHIFSDDTHQWRERIRLSGYAFDGTASTAWVDFDFVGDEIGTETNPFDTVAEGVEVVMAGGTVNIQPGTTAETITINKAVTLINIGAARGGTGVVRIGDPSARSFNSERDTEPAISGFISRQDR